MPPVMERHEDEPETEVIHTWSPCRIEVGEDYDYFPENAAFRCASRFMRRLVLTVFPIYNRLLFHLRVHGMEKLRGFQGGAVTICNHVHLLDCTIVADCFQRRMIYFPTIQSNLEMPVVGDLVRILGGIPIPKGTHAFRRFSEMIADQLRQGKLVHLYPEGILAPYYDGVRSFKRGAFTYACRSDVPVFPMVISYRRPNRFFALWHKRPFLTLHILDPIYPDSGLPSREAADHLRDRCWSAMDQCYRENNRL